MQVRLLLLAVLATLSSARLAKPAADIRAERQEAVKEHFKKAAQGKKECLAQCTLGFHGSLKTCVAKCRNAFLQSDKNPSPSIADDLQELEQHEAAEQKEEREQEVSDGMPIKFNADFQKKSAAKELAATDAEASAEFASHANDNYDSFGAPLRNDMEGNANLDFDKVVLDRSEAAAEAVDHTKIEARKNECMAQCMLGFHGTLRTCVKKCKNTALLSQASAPSIADDLQELEQHEAAEQKEEHDQEVSDGMPIKFNPDFQKKTAAKELAATDAEASAEFASHANDNYDSFGAPLRNDMEGDANLAFDKVVLDRSEAAAEAVDHTKIEAKKNECMAQCMLGFHGTLRTCVKKCKRVALVSKASAPSISDDLQELEQHEAAEQKEEREQEVSDGMPIKFNPDFQRKSAAKELAATDAEASAEFASHANDNYDSFGAPLRNDMEGDANLAFDKVVLDRSEAAAEAVDHTKIEAKKNECMAQCMLGFHGTLRTCVKKCKNVA